MFLELQLNGYPRAEILTPNSTIVQTTAEEFKVAPETMALATTLYVFGFAMGPILMGPASELYGRKLPFFAGYSVFVLSQIPVGLAQDVPTILVFRFLGGVGSSVPPVVMGGYLSDFLPPVERGVAITIFLATTLIGPPVGAIIGEVLMANSLSWRWTAWLSLVLGVLFGTIGFLLLPETYLPVLEKRHAARLRQQTKHWALHSKLDEKPVSVHEFVVRYLSRPLVMLILEPILLLMTLYISFTFGMIYLLFVVSNRGLGCSLIWSLLTHQAYPVSFVEERGFGLVEGALPLVSICVGNILGAFYVSYYTLTTIRRKSVTRGYLQPEDRLPPMIIGAGLFTIGLFWFAWTSSPRISPWPQILAGVPIGIGMQVILLQAITYLIDVYTVNANSAISGTVIVRSLIGSTFPLFALTMFQGLGVSAWPSRRSVISRKLTYGEGVLGFHFSRPLFCSTGSYPNSVLLLGRQNSLL